MFRTESLHVLYLERERSCVNILFSYLMHQSPVNLRSLSTRTTEKQGWSVKKQVWGKCTFSGELCYIRIESRFLR